MVSESLEICSVRGENWGFPGGSDSEESACNAGDQVRSLGWEDPPEEAMGTHSSILAWRIPMYKEVHGVTKSQTQLSDYAQR